jgi:hypothetical protein
MFKCAGDAGRPLTPVEIADVVTRKENPRAREDATPEELATFDAQLQENAPAYINTN